MSKNNVTKKAEEIKNEVLSDLDKANDAKQALKLQLEQHLKEAERHKTMAIKAQGALEVLLQLHPEEDNIES